MRDVLSNMLLLAAVGGGAVIYLVLLYSLVSVVLF